MPYSVEPYYSTTDKQVLTSNNPVELKHYVSSDRDKGSILVYETDTTNYLWLGKHYWIDTEENKIYFDPQVASKITIEYLRLI